jgi:hypothetical protein
LHAENLFEAINHRRDFIARIISRGNENNVRFVSATQVFPLFEDFCRSVAATHCEYKALTTSRRAGHETAAK